MIASAARVEFLTPTHCTGIFTSDVQHVRCSDNGRRLELIVQFVEHIEVWMCVGCSYS